MATAADGQPLILVAIDGTPSSMRAGAYAAGLARRQGAHLLCLYVRTESAVISVSVPGLVDAVRETKESLSEQLSDLVTTQAAALGLDVRFIERKGNPYAEIVRTAKELRADTVVVGASTQAGHRVIGSVGARLIRHGTCPVTVVP